MLPCFQREQSNQIVVDPLRKHDDPIIDEQSRAVAKAEAQLKATKAELLKLKQEQVERELADVKKQLELERHQAKTTEVLIDCQPIGATFKPLKLQVFLPYSLQGDGCIDP